MCRHENTYVHLCIRKRNHKCFKKLIRDDKTGRRGVFWEKVHFALEFLALKGLKAIMIYIYLSNSLTHFRRTPIKWFCFYWCSHKWNESHFGKTSFCRSIRGMIYARARLSEVQFSTTWTKESGEKISSSFSIDLRSPAYYTYTYDPVTLYLPKVKVTFSQRPPRPQTSPSLITFEFLKLTCGFVFAHTQRCFHVLNITHGSLKGLKII